eukprot:CAMPEP_0118650154 /NCGR_PEP_ID=MMETSP0785-20121206/10094_1 /TAXON_ID=91992 /ORGANISM="Bolidomonas pacifica, Strain CCMP 1866" /LENGTH=508 /DNA_ID=CAMNT_0006542507 /DNA_START=84 /DNA_END=1606 /DNA_ORIENTATION=-
MFWRRRLVEYNMTKGCCSMGTERERIRTAAALNFHIYPHVYDDVFDEDKNEAMWDRQKIFDDNQGHDGTLADIGETGVERAKNHEKYMVRQQERMEAFLLSDVNTASWDPRHTPEDRFNAGSQDATGVAMGVYTATNGEKMLVFRGSYSNGDFDNILKWMKDWILEKMEQTVKDSWTEYLGKELTAEQKARSGGDLQSRCALRAGTTLFTQMHNGDLANSISGVSKEDIKKWGYWPITKKMVRELLPADRDLASEPNIYLSGHSQGGARSSLVSMWLEKADGKKYKTYSISPIGVQCFSRRLSFLPGSSDGQNYLADVDPYVSHDQITSILHPLDYYALTDYQPGKVCHLGSSLLGTSQKGGADLEYYIDKTVGYTGPELMVDMFQTEPSKAFGMTRYWTHSITLTNILMSNLTFLDEDGVTDGGCYMEDIVPIDDPNSKCPKGKSDASCNALFLGVGVAIFTVIVVIPSILVCFCTHTCCFKKDPETSATKFEEFRTRARTVIQPKG